MELGISFPQYAKYEISFAEHLFRDLKNGPDLNGLTLVIHVFPPCDSFFSRLKKHSAAADADLGPTLPDVQGADWTPMSLTF